jgi:hypothetical protein
MTTVGARTPASRRVRSPEAVIACSCLAAPAGLLPRSNPSSRTVRSHSGSSELSGEPITLNVRISALTYASRSFGSSRISVPSARSRGSDATRLPLPVMISPSERTTSGRR